MKSIYLYPAQLSVSAEPAEIRTILGSCVAVALHDATTKIGGLNHYLLAEATHGDKTLRYGSIAIPALLEAMLEAGAVKSRIRAKIFGGAAVLQGLSSGTQIGERNIDFARREMTRLGIPVVEENVGGNRGRRITLRTDSFEVAHGFMNGRADDPDVTGAVVPKLVERARVLIVDDSVTVRSVFSRVLAQDPRVEVVGIAADAYEARELLIQKKPDVVLLDIEMPRMNGVTFLEKVMKHAPVPVIMVSSLGANEEAAHRCLELGAIEFVNKPSQFDPLVLRSLAESLVQKCLAAASVPLRRGSYVAPAAVSRSAVSSKASSSFDARSQIVVVGGNTGGQHGLVEMLQRLASDSPPVVVSMSSVTAFLKPFLERHQPKCQVRLLVATDGAVPTPGHVYFAPAEHHLTLEWVPGGPYRMVVRQGLPFCSQLPSCGKTFASLVAQKRDLSGVAAVLLSGFGNDGVDELVALRGAGARCIVANPASAPFAFLPGGAIRAGAADEVAEPAEMPELLLRLRNRAVAS